MAAQIYGELKAWHKTTLAFSGPTLSEEAATFTDYRLEVTFTHADGTTVTVPGYFAADGNAAETGATSGDIWHVHFNAPKEGEWTYSVEFQTGTHIAADRNAQGNAIAFDGETGTFAIAPTDKTGADFRGKGVLANSDGDRYLEFAGTGETWLKTGVDSPENFLAYEGFDGAPSDRNLKSYEVHEQDWQPGDPTWNGGEGKGIVGAVNYLADSGVNSVYFLTMNVAGDGRDVWPWANPNLGGVSKASSTTMSQAVAQVPSVEFEDFVTYDVSKLAQWEILFEHMQEQGVNLHVVLQETENDQLLDAGNLGFVDDNQLMSVERQIYLREMIARFAHHNAITWNLGEENTNSAQQRDLFFETVRDLDPYPHYTAIHTYPGQQNQVYNPLLGNPDVTGASIQTSHFNQTHNSILKWVEASGDAGRQWVVMADETTDASYGATQDALTPGHNEARSEGLWGALMAGGGGIEWYYGYRSEGTDLSLEDFRSRDGLYEQSLIAREFFEQYLPFTEMTPDDSLFVKAANSVEGYAMAKPGEVYAIYTEDGDREVSVDLSGATGEFVAYWFDPYEGGQFELAAVQNVGGGGVVNFGSAPASIIDNRVSDTPINSNGQGNRELLVEDAVLLVKNVEVDLGIAAEDVVGGQLAPGDLTGGTGGGDDDDGGGGDPPTGAIASYFFADTATDETLFEIQDGDAIAASSLAGRQLTIYALAEGEIGQAIVSLNGGTPQTENISPYSLFGDSNGDFLGGRAFGLGEYTFSATYFDPSGAAIASESVQFAVVEDEPLNQPPVVSDLTATTLEDTSLTVSASEFGFDPDGDLLFLNVAGAENGEVTLAGDGSSLSYIPDENFSGAETLTATFWDGNDTTVTGTAALAIAIEPVNDPPVVSDLTGTTVENAGLYAVTVPASAFGFDPDGDSLYFLDVTGAENGEVTLAGEASILFYTPDDNFSGVETLTATLWDQNDATVTSTATLTITVEPADPPTGAIGSYFFADTATDETLFEIQDGDAIAASSLSDRQLSIYALAEDEFEIGRATVSLNGSTPRTERVSPYALFGDNDGDFLGGRAFEPGEYTFSATYFAPGGAAIASESVQFSVIEDEPINQPPVVSDLTAIALEDASLTISASEFGFDPDGDALYFLDVTGAENGEVTLAGEGSILFYTPNENFSGTETLTATFWDQNDDTVTSTATLAIAVEPVSDPTIAVDDTFVFDYEEVAFDLSEDGFGIEFFAQSDIFANDIDVDTAVEDMYLSRIVDEPQFGELTLIGEASIWAYLPDPETFTGTDSFTYTSFDQTDEGFVESSVGTVTIVVNDYPVSETSDPIVALNIGSNESLTATDGTVFAADTTGIGNRYRNGAAIANAEDDLLYQTEAWHPQGLNYDFAVDVGSYRVELHFAEIWPGAFKEGGRVFDVALEGDVVEDNLDLFASVGARTATVQSYAVDVSDGNLDLDLLPGIQNPKLSALAIYPLDAGDATGV